MMQRSNESGRSMVEMLGVIAIIGVISVGAITSMAYVDSYFRVSATLMEIEQMARDINDIFSWAPDYEGLDNQLMCEEDVVHDCSTGYKIPNRWGGELNVAAVNNGDWVGFTITLTDVPRTACYRLIEQAPDTLTTMYSKTTSCSDSGNNIVFESN